MGKKNSVKKPGKKGIAGIISILILVVVIVAVMFSGKNEKVNFMILSEKDYPQEISSDVIPEYRDLERALACVVDDKVYVVVTRGEKPASGYKVRISKMKVETENDKQNLVVFATFKDPSRGNSMSQVLTYPVMVAETDLKKLPDEIELRVQYEE